MLIIVGIVELAPEGRIKLHFGKEFNDVCRCTFRIDNPIQDNLFYEEND